MNIKKKISFFTLFLISSFFIMAEVKAGTYYRYGSTIEAPVDNTSNLINSTWEDYYFAYRFTFVDKYGNIVSGTNPADIYFTGWTLSDNLGSKYKFSDKNYDPIPSEKISIELCSTDKCYMDNIIKYYKNNTKDFRTQLLNLTGNKTFDDGEFLVVEKLYTIDIRTTYERSRVHLYDFCQEISDEEESKPEECKEISSSSPTEISLIEVYSNYFNGTGLEVLKKLNDTKVGNTINGYTIPGVKDESTGIYTGIYFINNNRAVTNFTRLNIYDVDKKPTGFKNLKYVSHYTDGRGRDTVKGEISDTLKKNTSYGINIFTYDDLEDKPKCTYDNYRTFEGGRTWNKATNQCCSEGTYYRGITKKSTNGKAVHEGLCCKNKNDIYDPGKKKCVSENDCIESNHVQKGKDWNSNDNVCCDVGELFNGKNCIAKKGNISEGKKVEYKFTTYPSIAQCMNGTLNSVLSNLDVGNSKARVETSGTNIPTKEADLIIYNNKYKVAGKTDIYCKETLTTSFDSIKNNFNNLFSGVYVPIKNQPTVSKEIRCYLVDPNADNQNYRIKDGVDFVTDQSSDINVILYFMNGYKGPNYTSNGTKYSFTTPSIKVISVSSGKGSTTYGTKYTSVTAKLEYTFSGLSVQNKYIDMLTATNTELINDSKKYKTIDTSSIGVPTSAISGHYNNTIYLNKLDGLLNKINDSNKYSKTLTKDNGTGYCKLSYNSPFEISDCSSEYRDWIKKGENDTIGYSGEWQGGWCSFDILYKNYSEESCGKLASNNSTISTEYVSLKDKTVLKFVNNKTNSNAVAGACHFDIEVKDYELVFRPISLSNPFPGSDGSGRTPNNKVWPSEKIGYYIKDRQDAYTKKPLYSVTLTSSQIKNIRKYNKNHKYDDFNLKCVGSKTGTACYSSFIRTYLNKTKSVCDNTNNQSESEFNSCADYSKRS